MIHISNISKHYGPKILFKDASFQINPGEKIGLVGPNGSGKTTLFRAIVGEEAVEQGQIARSERLRIGYFSQNTAEMSGSTVLEEVKKANPRVPAIQKRLQEIELRLAKDLDAEEMTKILEEYGELQSEFEGLDGYNLETKASEILTGLGIGPDSFCSPVESFSGGWKMRIALAQILLLSPDVLLMDEPTNHLDLESIIWLESWLSQFPGSLLMTCHDREFMNRVVSKIVEVAHQQITVYSGNYDFYEKERQIREAKLLASAKRQEEMLAKEKEFIARFAARASHAAQVQSRVKKLEKIEIIEVPPEEKTMDFIWPVPPRGGDEVLKVENLGKTWITAQNTEKLVFRHAHALVKRLDRVAVVGINGAGKSSFLKIITGQTEATEGTYAIGPSIEVGYFSQNSLDLLNPSNSIIEEMESRLPHSSIGFVRNLLGAFRFSGDEVEKKISVLSGGEKSRLVLATILARPVNFLVLDEPTNHLDIKAREVLLEAIKQFPGTVMMVSHDRYFLRELTTRVFEIDQQELHIYEGSWDHYLEKKKR